VAFEKRNPDVASGTIREDILNEKVLSAIVEIKVPGSRRAMREVAPILERLGYKVPREDQYRNRQNHQSTGGGIERMTTISSSSRRGKNDANSVAKLSQSRQPG